ncbi:MAG: SDR family oxidoreductase [Sphingomonadaceae bacterium]|nr:SDR family oxidoreductase [Sphingomonadaceae bacterium]
MSLPGHHRVYEAPAFDTPPLPPDMLAGKVALVTGGGSGMGLGMAMALAQAGASIAVFGRTAETAEKGAEELRALGRPIGAYVGDVRKPDDIAAAFDAAERELGLVTILANNAGANYPVLAESVSPGQWRSVTRIAIDGSFLCSTEFARRLIAAREGGAIVNNSAQYIWSGFPGDAHSAAAKAAIATMTAAHAADWKRHGIRANCVAAGFFPHARSNTSNVMEDRTGLMIPVGRVGRMREFGWVSAFLCSPLAAGITGETLMIDGGDSLRRQLMSPAFEPPRDRENPWGNVP